MRGTGPVAPASGTPPWGKSHPSGGCMRTQSRSLKLLLSLLAAFALIVAVCGDDDGDNGAADNGTPATDATNGDTGDNGDNGETADGSDIKVGMVYDIGGRGDQSFNDAAYVGLSRAA